jgi:hypothetical protein
MTHQQFTPIKFILQLLAVLFAFVSNAQNGLTDEEERIDARIKIHYTRNEYTPAKENAYHVVKQDYNITGLLSCQVMTFRIESFKGDVKTRSKCNSASMHCPVLSGASKRTEYDADGNVVKDVNLPVTVQVTQTILDEKDGKLVVTNRYTAGGENDMDEIIFEVKPYWAADGQVQPLAPNYVIWLTGGIGFDFKNPRRKPTGEGNGEAWDDWKQQLVPVEGPFSITIPSDLSVADHAYEINEVYDQLLMTNYAELDNFLLNPKGEFVIKKSGKRYLKSEGSQETEGQIDVEITLTPHVTINELKF